VGIFLVCVTSIICVRCYRRFITMKVKVRIRTSKIYRLLLLKFKNQRKILRSEKMSGEDWIVKLERGESLPPKFPLTKELLEELGVSPSKAPQVLASLTANGRDTWGTLVDLVAKSEERTIEKAGDEVSGERIWNWFQKQKEKKAGEGMFK
jgi:hypothetical protein